MINLKKGAEGAISRREVVGGLAAGAVGLVAGWTKPADAEPPPETVAGLRRDRPHHGVRRAVRHPDRRR
ncbi:MAG: hypothetical protein DME16_05825 [Candidatus Rokuibacteriota bacterium]|nr:MAG: hypothetical protein DME16_05825 [Candidatus Rokubacteria bacterium]